MTEPALSSMDTEDTKRKREILEALKKRKHERELQAAMLGVSADPIIKTEIEDIKVEIATLERLLGNTAEELPKEDNKLTNNIKEQRRGCSIRVELFFTLAAIFLTISITFATAGVIGPEDPTIRAWLSFILITITITALILSALFFIIGLVTNIYRSRKK